METTQDTTVETPEGRARRLATDPANLRRARQLAEYWCAVRPGLGRFADEIESAALMGLWEAARGFDPDAGFKFWTYAGSIIRGRMLDECRALGSFGLKGGVVAVRRGEFPEAPVSLSAPRSGPTTYDESCLADFVPSGCLPVGWEAEYEDEVRALARRCPAGHGEVIIRMYLHADSARMKAAAAAVGLSESRVSQIHTQVAQRHGGLGKNRRVAGPTEAA